MQISLKVDVNYFKNYKWSIFHEWLRCKSIWKLWKILRICVRSFVNLHPGSVSLRFRISQQNYWSWDLCITNFLVYVIVENCKSMFERPKYIDRQRSFDLRINFLHSKFFGKILGGNSQNFLGKFLRFFVTLRCFYWVVIHRKWVLYDLYSS